MIGLQQLRTVSYNYALWSWYNSYEFLVPDNSATFSRSNQEHMEFLHKHVLITGGSRGIGKAIAIRLARAGANVAIVGKTTSPNPKLEGTIYSAAEEIERSGPGKVLALEGDIRFEDRMAEIVAATTKAFGGLDILINNASAINLASTLQTEPKRYDLLQDINVRGTFFMCRAAIPILSQSTNAHILNLSPPLNMDPRWFSRHLAYTMSKYGMSMIVLGLAEELKKARIAVNALWPRTTIATAAVNNLLGGEVLMQRSRTPEIVADAAFYILQKPSVEFTGQFLIDEDLLVKEGISDFAKYAVNPSQELMRDLFL